MRSIVPPGRGPALGKQLADVAHLLAEPRATLAAEQVTVVLEEGAAPGAVHDDRIVRTGKGGDVPFGQAPRGLPITGVLVQRAATRLRFRTSRTW